jgi:TM2 domain-containing membrane protein YozV
MKYIKSIRIFLLVLIIIGLGLLVTQNMWVPKVVDWLMSKDKKVYVEEKGKIVVLGPKENEKFCWGIVS